MSARFDPGSFFFAKVTNQNKIQEGLMTRFGRSTLCFLTLVFRNDQVCELCSGPGQESCVGHGQECYRDWAQVPSWSEMGRRKINSGEQRQSESVMQVITWSCSA